MSPATATRGRARATPLRRNGALAPSRISRATLTSQLEDALRADIVAGLLEPGAKLRAGDITQLYGVSATPMREALQRLSAEGLVSLDPKLGARVAPVSLTDVRDVFDVRLLLEPDALRRAIARGDDAWLRELTVAYAELRAAVAAPAPRDHARWRESMLRTAEAHRDFHWALLSACGSPWLMRFIFILHGHSSRYRMLLTRPRDRSSWTKGHDVLYEAARRRDAARAVRALERHILSGLEAIVRASKSARDKQA